MSLARQGAGPLGGNSGLSSGRVIALAAAALLLAGVPALFVALRDSTPPLAPDDIERARERWRRSGPADYDISLEIRTDARPEERFEARVRGGKTERLLRNGAPVDTRDAYTVPGLFQIMEREIEMARPGGGTGDAGPGVRVPPAGGPRRARLRALFDERLGFPIVFKRMAPNRLSLVIRVDSIRTPSGEVIHGVE